MTWAVGGGGAERQEDQEQQGPCGEAAFGPGHSGGPEKGAGTAPGPAALFILRPVCAVVVTAVMFAVGHFVFYLGRGELNSVLSGDWTPGPRNAKPASWFLGFWLTFVPS